MQWVELSTSDFLLLGNQLLSRQFIKKSSKTNSQLTILLLLTFAITKEYFQNQYGSSKKKKNVVSNFQTFWNLSIYNVLYYQ